MDLKAWTKKITDVLMPLESVDVEDEGRLGEETVVSMPRQASRTEAVERGCYIFVVPEFGKGV